MCRMPVARLLPQRLSQAHRQNERERPASAVGSVPALFYSQRTKYASVAEAEAAIGIYIDDDRTLLVHLLCQDILA